MFAITACPLPENALSRTYLDTGAYTDCYRTEIPHYISHAQFITAFYTTWVFKLERLILKWAVSRPSTDFQAAQLAEGTTDRFAAWHVEDRCEDQLLMCNFHGRTRSWLMVAEGTGSPSTTVIYFGSVVTAVQDQKSGRTELGGCLFSALLGFHKIYSRVLLSAARSRLLAEYSRQKGHKNT